MVEINKIGFNSSKWQVIKFKSGSKVYVQNKYFLNEHKDLADYTSKVFRCRY